MAQKSQKRRHSQQNHNAIKVKGSKAKIVCPIYKESRFPYHGIGFKLGDPFALTYKLYASKKISICIDAGKAASGLYSRHYQSLFDHYLNRDTLGVGNSLGYLTYRVISDWVGEVKALYSIDVSNLSEGLQFYLGLGLQGKNTSLEYTYQYNTTDIGKFSRTYSTVGQTTIAGIEYNYFQIPLSAYMELEMFTDVHQNFGVVRFQGGAGLRYIFR